MLKKSEYNGTEEIVLVTPTPGLFQDVCDVFFTVDQLMW